MATYTLSYPGDTVQLLLDKINSLNYYTRPQVLELLEQYARMVEVQSIVASKQDRLVSGTNIKTVDGQSIVGGGNVDLSRFVTATANNLANYYLKSDVYTKAEVQQLISSVQGFAIVSAVALPDPSSLTLNKFYLVPSTNPQSRNIKEEFITIETPQGYAWEQIGSTAIDITAYSTTTQMTAAINAAIAGKQDAIEAIQVSIDGTSGTPSGSASMSGNTLQFSFSGIKGNDGATGAAAGFGTPTASVDDQTGTPSVQVSASGPDTAKVFSFAFHNLKGAKGETGATGPQGPKGDTGETGAAGVTSAVVNVDNTSGTPSATATVQNGVLTINISGIKGEQGNSGYTGAAGELEVVNNDTDGGAAKAWSAERGKVLVDRLPESIVVEEEGIYFIDTECNIGAQITSDGLSGINLVQSRIIS